MISANGVTLRVGKKALFEDVNIKFTEGNCYGLIGANGAGKEVYESNRRAFLAANGTRMELLREQIMVYFVFGYFCGAVYNDNPYGKLKLAVAATILVEELLMAEWLREDLPEKKIVDLVHCFSREVEHSDENRGLLEDELVKREEFRLKALLAAVIEWKRA